MAGFCPGCGEEVDYGALFCEFCDSPVDARVLETRVVGPFTGWTGATTLTLENGKQWRQAGPGHATCALDSPRAWLYPDAGGQVLRVEGVPGAVPVVPVPPEAEQQAADSSSF